MIVTVDPAVVAALPLDTSVQAEKPASANLAAATAKPAAEPAAVGITIVKEPGTVSAGGRASVTIRTAPRATCSITVWYKSGPSTAAGLDDAQADAKGIITWSWKVGTRTTPGTWSVTIACGDQWAETSVTVL